jgi:hypothetical protein
LVHKKIYFFIFWALVERGKKNSALKRKYLSALILATTMVEISVKLFYLMRKVHIRCFFFFYLEIA